MGAAGQEMAPRMARGEEMHVDLHVYRRGRFSLFSASLGTRESRLDLVLSAHECSLRTRVHVFLMAACTCRVS